jgi:hypothetical protein
MVSEGNMAWSSFRAALLFALNICCFFDFGLLDLGLPFFPFFAVVLFAGLFAGLFPTVLLLFDRTDARDKGDTAELLELELELEFEFDPELLLSDISSIVEDFTKQEFDEDLRIHQDEEDE